MSEPRTVSRALPLRVELVRQLRRRRTAGLFGVLVALPLIVIAAIAIVGGDGQSAGPRSFVDLVQESGADLTVFVLFAATGFLVIVTVALFAGDSVPTEASWSSLRYLLAAPISRTRLIRQKLITAAIYSTAALVFLAAWSLLVGGLAYGFGPYVGTTGDQIGWPAFAGRLAIIVGYLLLGQLVVAALAFAFGVWTDAPLGAVGGAVVVMIIFAILDSIPALGGLRQAFPGHYAYAWADALTPQIDPSAMISGILWSVGYSIVLTSVAVWHFLRKDITS